MLQSPKKDALLIGVGGDLTDFLFVNLVACIDYTFGASPKHHQTAFTLQVRMSDGRVISASKTPIPASSLALLPFFIGTSYVN
jgi:hypothetical protein